MKHIFLLVSLTLLINANAKTKWHSLETNGKVVPVSKIAKIGRVSVFIISSSWCTLCKGLKKRLANTEFEKENIDFYYVEIVNSENQKRFAKKCRVQILDGN